MPDPYRTTGDGSNPALRAQAVTKNDTTEYDPTRGVYIGGAGDLAVTMNGVNVTFVGMAAGVVHPLSVTKIRSTNTTATDIVILY